MTPVAAGRPGAPDVAAWLRDPRQYRRQIDRLHRRHVFSAQLYELEQDGVSLATMCWNGASLARALSRTVARGAYEFAPAKLRPIVVDDKERIVFDLRLTDAIVAGVVAAVIDEAMQPRLSPGLYSYRKGRSWWSAITDCAAYVRGHRRERPDPRTRGLFVLRRDVDAYTDSIPVGATSLLWPMLRDLLGDQAPVSEADWRLIEQVVRPEASVGEGGVFTLYRGVPTGQPVSCVLFNFYLLDLDRELSRVSGAFYARYSDDILFAHPEPQVVLEASDRIDAELARLGLRANPSKRRDLYVTAAGRPAPGWPHCRAATAIPFLGCRVSFAGAVSLSRRKTRRLLTDLERRAVRATRGASGRSTRELGVAVCAVLNRALSPRPSPFQGTAAALVRRVVTDREHLKQLDYWIARIALRTVTGDGSAKAFRQIPYRTVREEWGLMSVRHARDCWPGR